MPFALIKGRGEEWQYESHNKQLGSGFTRITGKFLGKGRGTGGARLAMLPGEIFEKERLHGLLAFVLHLN